MGQTTATTAPGAARPSQRRAQRTAQNHVVRGSRRVDFSTLGGPAAGVQRSIEQQYLLDFELEPELARLLAAE